MMTQDFPQYAELWQEQIDPEELAQLQARAKDIERTAKRKRLFDLSLAFGAIGLIFVVAWGYSASLQIKLGLALIVAAVIWTGWRRHEITKSSRATAIYDPRVFFETAIKNVRAEINLSTVSLCLAVPILIFGSLLVLASRGLNSVDSILREMLDVNFEKTMLAAAAFVLASGYFVRENIKLREQLRRLEGMSREWDEQQARDLEESP